MTFPELSRFLAMALLLMRLMVGAIFITSGWSHVTRAEERAKSIEMSKSFTLFLGVAELAGGLGVVFGVLTQLAALGLILGDARRDLQENQRVAHRVLGRKVVGVALRLDAGAHEPGDCYYERRVICPDEIVSSVGHWKQARRKRFVQLDRQRGHVSLSKFLLCHASTVRVGSPRRAAIAPNSMILPCEFDHCSPCRRFLVGFMCAWWGRF